MLKKFSLTFLAALILGIGLLYCQTYQSYQAFARLSYEDQVRQASANPIQYMLMKDLLFWIDVPPDRFKPQS